MKNDFHPCTFAALSVWMRLLWENGGIPPRYWRKFAGIFATSAALPYGVGVHRCLGGGLRRDRSAHAESTK